MTKLKCLNCGCINELDAKTCVECEMDLGDPTVNRESIPRATRTTTTY